MWNDALKLCNEGCEITQSINAPFSGYAGAPNDIDGSNLLNDWLLEGIEDSQSLLD